jgi:hypothetical protein
VVVGQPAAPVIARGGQHSTRVTTLAAHRAGVSGHPTVASTVQHAGDTASFAPVHTADCHTAVRHTAGCHTLGWHSADRRADESCGITGADLALAGETQRPIRRGSHDAVSDAAAPGAFAGHPATAGSSPAPGA